ncbi:MAG TPA: trypsin-like peptidase domain-containing protein, partial [Thermomicrobiales bacterium]|nr:trypsin-like peptidase domain-containing protein [Thermomicrobiales bacterium]
MAGQQVSRLRRVALTGVLTPVFILGAARFDALPGGIFPSGATAQSVIDGGACTAFGAAQGAQATEMSVADVAEKANPAVVSILNLQPISEADASGFPGIEGIPGIPEIPGIEGLPGSEEAPGAEDEGTEQIEDSVDSNTLVPVGTGSGFIIDADGHVITNAHVVAGAEELTVALADGTEVSATVVGSDELLDVAILKLDLSAADSVPGIATFGDSSALRAGDQVVAIGNALGSFPNTVSEGTVNATDRSFPTEGGLTTWIQHDAEIWHGNSGGPLLNLHGEVVGVNTAGIGSGMLGADTGSADMAFAVEGNTVCRAAADLLANGKIDWPYLGIEGLPGSEEAP